MKAADIPDDVFMDAVQHVMEINDSVWANRFETGKQIAHVTGTEFPEKVVLAKARQLYKRKILHGCMCGCRGDFHPAEGCQLGNY